MHKAFSLVEVLVVIAIVAILSGVMFSTFGGAKRGALLTQTYSDLRQYHTALNLYEADHGAYPTSNPKHEGLVVYFGGQYPHPVFAPKGAAYDQGQHGYSHHAFADWIGWKPLDKECFYRRGPSMPMAHDWNWRRPEVEMSQKISIIPFIRFDGSAAREKANYLDEMDRFPERFPCPGAFSFGNMR